jgi:hypothetical protein
VEHASADYPVLGRPNAFLPLPGSLRSWLPVSISEQIVVEQFSMDRKSRRHELFRGDGARFRLFQISKTAAGADCMNNNAHRAGDAMQGDLIFSDLCWCLSTPGAGSGDTPILWTSTTHMLHLAAIIEVFGPPSSRSPSSQVAVVSFASDNAQKAVRRPG